MAAQIPKHRQLPDKEAKLFKELLVQYEHKQYKKGIKAADTILKKFPNHGETLAIKALTLFSSLPFPATVTSLPKQEEAEAMAKTAVKKDLTSHITWHVLGIMAKGRKDWDEATRAFAMARKQDNDNLPILRDSIALYLHSRQYPQALAARHQYFLLRPNLRSSWLALMVSHQLMGDHDEALEVYDGMVSAMNTDGASAQDKSQITLNVIKACMDANENEDGLRRLDMALANKVISPRGEASQLRAEMLMKVGRKEAAEDAYRSLLEQNPDNLDYYRGFLRTKDLDLSKATDEETSSKILHQLDAFAQTYPKSPAPKRLALTVAQGDEFQKRIRPYLVNGLEKGIPSLFVDVKALYSVPEKMVVVGEVVENVIDSLQKDSSLHEDDTIAPPTALLWAYYYLALHLSHPLHLNPSFKRSLDLLEIALKHTPTLPEVYMAKAMILKRAGDPYQAAHVMEEARLLDGQDRFLNGKAAKYWLRAGEVKKAEELLAMFTKKDLAAVQDLTDLQCLWFMKEEGNAHSRNGNLALALKRYQSTVTTFQDYEDDQYDFHTYCMRRMTISAYLSLMKYEDQLRSHPAYFDAVLSAIGIYTKIHDDPSLTEERLTAEEEAERKKAAKKAQKAEQKAKKAAAAAADGTKKEEAPIPDPDPLGETLLKTETPLEHAYKIWLPLEKLASQRIETWTSGYEIQIRRKLWLAAFKCLVEAHTIDPEHPTLHKQLLHFHRLSQSGVENFPKLQLESISMEFPILKNISSPSQYNSEYTSKYSKSATHILGAAYGLIEVKKAETKSEKLSESDLKQVIAVLEKLSEKDVAPSISIMVEAINMLRSLAASEGEIQGLKLKFKERCPLAVVFDTKEDLEKKKGLMLNGIEAVNGVKADV